MPRKPGVKHGDFPGVNLPQVLGTLKQEREQVKIWDTTGDPTLKSYLDRILSLQSKAFRSLALFISQLCSCSPLLSSEEAIHFAFRKTELSER